MRSLRVLAVAALALAAVAYAGVARPDAARSAEPQAAPNGITVDGTGAVTTTPDRAEMSFGVVTRGQTASAALRANAAAAQRLIDALKRAGVAAADIQTQYVSLSPNYVKEGEAPQGYTASNTVSARINELSRAGAVIDAAVEAGADTVSGPNLTRGERNDLYRDALRAAVANARANAQVLATAGGVSLGRVVKIVEGGGEPVWEAMNATRAADMPATPIEAGTQRIEARVTVTFAAS